MLVAVQLGWVVSKPTPLQHDRPQQLDCLFGVNVHMYTALYANLSTPLQSHLGTGVTSLYGLGHGSGRHGTTPDGSVDFIDHPTQLFQPNTSYWRDAWDATLRSAPGYMADYTKAEIQADPNPNTNTTHSTSGVLMLDYEPAYRPSWRFQTASRPDKKWEAFVSSVHTPKLDQNWTRLVGYSVPAGTPEGGWDELKSQEQQALMAKSYDYFCKTYLSAGMKAIRAAIPPAMMLSVWNWPFKFGGSTAANETALQDFEAMIAEMDWLWQYLDIFLPDLYPEFFVGQAANMPAVLSRCTVGNQSDADLYFSANIAHMQRIRDRCSSNAKIYLSTWWHYMCAQKVLDSDNLDYYAQDANVMEPFSSTGHDGVILWGTVGTFGYEDHDPAFVAAYLNRFWAPPIEAHCKEVTRSVEA